MIKAAFILLAGLAVVGVLRRRSASTRHWILAWTLACAAVLPFLEFLIPSWKAPFEISWLASSASGSRLVFGGGTVAGVGRAMGSASTEAPSLSVLRFSALQWVWFAGVVASLSGLGIGLVRLARTVARSTPVVDGPWVRALATLTATSPGSAVRLVRSDHPALLFTWGLRQPTIVLPLSAPTWPADRIRAVLGHELAHVRRRDWAVQMLALLVRCVHWFNPLVWVACRQLRRESEQACDDVVLGSGMGAAEYATHVIEVAQLFRRAGCPAWLPAMSMVRPSSFERRVHAMLKPGIDRSPISGLAGLATASALVLLSIPLAGLTAVSSGDPAVVVLEGHGASLDRTAAPGIPQTAPAAPTALAGTIRDPLGKTMPDVVVDVAPAATPNGPKPQVRTGPDGRFEVKGLPPGEYDVTSLRPGFKRNLIRVALKPNAPVALNIALQIGSLSETINVQADRNATDSSSEPAPVRATPSAVAQAGSDPCDASTVGGCLTPPRKLVDVKPSYPPGLAGSGGTAVVVVKAVLGVDGRLGRFEPQSGPDPAFVDAALEAIRQWQFTPVRLNGVPQECQVTVTINFSVR